MEDRTRTYQTRQGIHFRRGTFDDQFDCELPEEARTELSEEIPPQKTYRSRKIPAYRPAPPPAKRSGGATVIGAIAIVALFLYAVSRTGGPSTSTAPPESRSVPIPLRSQPVEVRRALPPPVEVRRALPCQGSKCAKHSRRSHVLCPSILLPSPSRLLAGDRFECRTAALSRSTTRVNCPLAQLSRLAGVLSAKSGHREIPRGSG